MKNATWFATLGLSLAIATAGSAQQLIPKSKKFSKDTVEEIVERCQSAVSDFTAIRGGEKVKVNVTIQSETPVFIRWIDFEG